MSTSKGGAEGQDRTGDTAIFSRVLYRLSYLGPMASRVGCPSAVRRIPRASAAVPEAGVCGPPLLQAGQGCRFGRTERRIAGQFA